MVIVSNYSKPDLGAVKTITLSCADGTTDITTLYNTVGLTATYNTITTCNAPAGLHWLIVTNANECSDTAFITVLDASVTPVANTKTANRECTDVQRWTPLLP